MCPNQKIQIYENTFLLFWLVGCSKMEIFLVFISKFVIKKNQVFNLLIIIRSIGILWCILTSKAQKGDERKYRCKNSRFVLVFPMRWTKYLHGIKPPSNEFRIYEFFNNIISTISLSTGRIRKIGEIKIRCSVTWSHKLVIFFIFSRGM